MSFRVLALVGVISSPIAGYPQFPIVRNFSPQDYNGAAQNWDLANSQFNYIFVANNAGLMVGNGIGWDCIAVPNGTAVRSVATSMDGTRFYIGAFDEFGYFENVVPLRCGRYVSISSSLSADMARSGDIWTTLVLPDGRIAFQGDRRIYIYNPLSRSVRIFIFRSKIERLWKTGQRVYAADTSALYFFDKDRFVCMKASESIAVRAVRGSVTLPGIPGDVFICRDGTLWTLGPEGPDRIVDSAFSTTVAGKNVFCVADCPMRVLVGTVGDGLIILDKKSGEIQLLDRSNGLRNNTILSICPDVDENVWVGLDNGLGYIVFDSPFRTLFTESNGIGTGYASASLGDRLYVGANQGLYHIPPAGRRL